MEFKAYFFTNRILSSYSPVPSGPFKEQARAQTGDSGAFQVSRQSPRGAQQALLPSLPGRPFSFLQS